MAQIPPVFHAEVRRALDWHDEPRFYRGPLGDDLPGDLRLPRLYGLDETDQRITLWLEDVDDATPWDLTRYQRTTRHLGQLAGRWPEERARESLPGIRRRTMAQLFHGKISNADIPALADDELWETPAVRAATAEHGDLRGDLQRLAEVAPALVDAYEELPHSLAHVTRPRTTCANPVRATSWPSTSATSVRLRSAVTSASCWSAGSSPARRLSTTSRRSRRHFFLPTTTGWPRKAWTQIRNGSSPGGRSRSPSDRCLRTAPRPPLRPRRERSGRAAGRPRGGVPIRP
jgi:hypothetical protein